MATFLILGVGVFVLSKPLDPKSMAVSQNAKADAGEKTYEWGEIKYDGPKATKTFTIKNTGSDILQLSNIKTSCSCTSAQVKTKSKNSPLFSMHSTSSWIGEVQPGDEVQLEVIFDQQFHGPSGVGPATRIITVETNDANNPKLELTLTGNVVKR